MITLIPFSPGHVTSLISWIDSEEMLMQFAGPSFHYPLTPDQLAYQANDPSHLSYSLVSNSPRELLGYGEIKFNNHTAFLCRLIIAPEKRGQGYGQILIRELLAEVKRLPKITQVELNVFDFNNVAIHLYEKFGFVANSDRVFERTINGQLWKAINMVLARN